MRAWIWIAIVVMGCGSKADKAEKDAKIGKVESHVEVPNRIVIRQVGEHLIARVGGVTGRVTYFRIGAITDCATGAPPCRHLASFCPDCIPPICDCRVEECSRMCDPRWWEHELAAEQWLKDLGLDDPLPDFNRGPAGSGLPPGPGH
jgi:hypothetical protein